MARPRNNKMVKEVTKFRKKGLTFRQIAKVLDSDVKIVHWWYRVGVKK